jgi:hypothetical protein
MKRILIIAVFFFLGDLITSCNPEKRTDNVDVAAETTTIKTCFAHLSKDTVLLLLKTTGTEVRGVLRYTLYEKDLNEGILDGEMKGDTLVANYNFYSEGISSTREVVFLKKNNQLIEGFGETIASEGKQIFKNRGTLDFTGSLVLTLTECNNKYGILE